MFVAYYVKNVTDELLRAIRGKYKTKMEKEKFIIENGEVIGVDNEKTITIEDFKYNGLDLRVLVTRQPTDSYNQNYFNVYVINYMFKLEPLNCLDHQTEVNGQTKEDFNRLFCETVAIQNYLWAVYGNPSKDVVLNFSVTYEKDEL